MEHSVQPPIIKCYSLDEIVVQWSVLLPRSNEGVGSITGLEPFYMDSLHVLQLPPTVQKHATQGELETLNCREGCM